MTPWGRILLGLLALGALGCGPRAARDVVRLEFHLRQDMDQILFSDFGEPPQIAVWKGRPTGFRKVDRKARVTEKRSLPGRSQPKNWRPSLSGRQLICW